MQKSSSLTATNLQRQISEKLKTVVGKVDDKTKRSMEKSNMKEQ
jgi:hypothetical protein